MMDCTALADQLAARNLALIVVCSLVALYAVVRWFTRPRGSRPDRVLRSIERGDYSRALVRAAAGRERTVQVVEREGFYTQYRFPEHEQAECVNAQCADHWGPYPKAGAR